LAQLHAQWPELELELTTGASGALAQQVLAHTLDAALVAWPLQGLEPDAPLERTAVYQESLLLALPADHPPVHSPADVRLHTLAAFGTSCTYRHIGQAWMQSAPGGAGNPDSTGKPLKVLELASYHAILACVAAGRCAGVVPQAVWDLMREPPPLRLVPLQRCDTVLVRRRGYQSPALDALLHTLLGATQGGQATAPLWISTP
jgi:DNA-binding transcriptional LysR family regulator